MMLTCEVTCEKKGVAPKNMRKRIQPKPQTSDILVDGIPPIISGAV